MKHFETTRNNSSQTHGVLEDTGGNFLVGLRFSEKVRSLASGSLARCWCQWKIPIWRYTEHYWTICLLITFHVFVRIFGDTKRCQTESSISLFWKFQFVSLLITRRGPEAQAKSPRPCVATVVVCRSRPYFWSLDGSRIGFQESCEEDNIGKDFLLIAQWMKKDYKKSKVQHFSFACPTLCVFCVSWNQNLGRYAFTFAPASHRCYWMLEMFEMQDQFSIYRTTNC